MGHVTWLWPFSNNFKGSCQETCMPGR